MTLPALREQLIAALDTISEDRVAHLLRLTISSAEGRDSAINADLTNAYERLVNKSSSLTDDELSSLLRIIRTWHEAEEQIKRYDPTKDRMLNGVFEGSPDLSSRVREILAQGFGRNKSVEEEA